jgi:hypothetical protein
MTTNNECFNLVEMTKEGTQLRTIAVIFENNIGNPISKRDIEKEYTARTMAAKISFPITFTSMEHLIASLDYAPGDVQRQLRTFHVKFKRYGLVRKENPTNKPPGLSSLNRDKLVALSLKYNMGSVDGVTNKKLTKDELKKQIQNCDLYQEELDNYENDNILYIWNPKKKSDLDTIVRPALRNIFKTDLDRDAFVQSKEDKCELCEISSKEERLAVDHWRAHSVYNIDEQGIAVLLCETCNNIHHNYDASKCIVNNKDNIKYIKNWIKTEKKVREMGYLPNEEDLKTQGENIQTVNVYYETMHPLPPEFWEGLA